MKQRMSVIPSSVFILEKKKQSSQNTQYTPRAPKNNCMSTEIWKKHASRTQASRRLLEIFAQIYSKGGKKLKTLYMGQCSESLLLASLFDSEMEVVTHTGKGLSWSNTVSNVNELFQSYVKQILWLCGTHQTTLLVFSKFSLVQCKWNWYILGRLLYISCLVSPLISNALGSDLSCWSILSWNVTPNNRSYSMDLILSDL